MKPQITIASNAERVSALVDGQLSLTDYAELRSAFENDTLLLKKWNAYHVIGETLRSSKLVGECADLSFLKRFHQRLSAEGDFVSTSSALDLKAPIVAVSVVPSISTRVSSVQKAANDSTYRWKAVAGLACLIAVGAIGWNTVGLVSGAESPQLALGGDVIREQVIVASPLGPVVRDVRLDEFLAAHRQLGSPSAVQMPSGFVWNAAFDTPQNGGR